MMGIYKAEQRREGGRAAGWGMGARVVRHLGGGKRENKPHKKYNRVAKDGWESDPHVCCSEWNLGWSGPGEKNDT